MSSHLQNPGDDQGRQPDPRYPGYVVQTVGRIARMHRTLIGGLLRSVGVFPGQEVLLMQLFERDRRSQTELVKSLDLDPSTVTKMLQRMARSGWIRREQSASDRRVVLVSLTDKGERLRQQVADAWREVEETTIGFLTPPEREQLQELLDRVDSQVRRRKNHLVKPTGPAAWSRPGSDSGEWG